ncbi:CpaD family pilus assembly lipoprotein [Sphingosinicella sp. LHD-64]|uniref:CpaD family pilus assembly protein n=1 Tax=Sphingosinicella sp. LHD-64 TaxID=3072139 RepID=UPI00280F6018|nr:CpaD family pilus assembly lipoprotein [Sphingosinicella sp. LHD-64]MDQ8755393.1 CpaD family pilus assembly lipoprotein [Sphingosinicella sp. LHD-64]
MVRSKHALAATLLGIGATGCTPVQDHVSALNNPTLYSVHQPVVQRTDYVFDASAGDGGLSLPEQARLDAWFASIHLRYGDTVTIDEAAGYESVRARDDISNVAGRYGLLLGDGAPVTAGAVQPGTVRVIASRASASVSGCPVWNNLDIAPVSTTSSNFGCATNSNLAGMVANPDDLVAGQDGSVASGSRTAARAIRVYRERQPTGTQGLQQTSTTRGN